MIPSIRGTADSAPDATARLGRNNRSITSRPACRNRASSTSRSSSEKTSSKPTPWAPTNRRYAAAAAARASVGFAALSGGACHGRAELRGQELGGVGRQGGQERLAVLEVTVRSG